MHEIDTYPIACSIVAPYHRTDLTSVIQIILHFYNSTLLFISLRTMSDPPGEPPHFLRQYNVAEEAAHSDGESRKTKR